MAVAFEFFAKLGVPYYCFHDRDVAPEGGRFAEFRANLDALADDAAGLPGADRRPPAVGHGQPVHPPALPGRRGHQSRSRGVRLRRGAGQAHARGHPAPRRRELRPVGRPRGLRHAAQHGPAARGRPARALPAPRRRAQAPDRVQGPAPHRAQADGADQAPVRLRRRDRPRLPGPQRPRGRVPASTSRRTTRRSPATASTTRSRSRSPTASWAASTRTAAIRRTAGTPTSSRTRSRTWRCRSTRSSSTAASRRAASTSTPSCAARAPTGPTCSTPTSAASTRSPGRSWSPRDLIERGELAGRSEARYAGWDGRARHGDPRRRRARSRSLEAQGRRRRDRPATGVGPPGAARERRQPARSGRPTAARVDDGRRPLIPMAYVIGIDVSTTATKAVLVDETRARSAASASPSTASRSRDPLWSEQEPALWWDGAVACDPVGPGRRPGSPGTDVAAVGLTGQMHGLVLLDAAGEVLRPAILWNDQRTAAECDVIRAGGRAGAAHRDHRQRRPDRVHRAEARLGPRPRARRLGARRPRPAAQGLRPAPADRRARARQGRRRGHDPVRPRGPRLVAARSSRRSQIDPPGCRRRSRARTVTGHRHAQAPPRRPVCGPARRSWPVAATRRRTPSASARSPRARWRCRSARPASSSPPTDRPLYEPRGRRPRVLPRGARTAGT